MFPNKRKLRDSGFVKSSNMLIGKKIGVTNYWEPKTGFRKTCTLIHIPDNHVLRYFPKDEFNGITAACIVGAGDGMGLMKKN